VAEVAGSMRADGYLCRTATIKIRFDDFKTYTKAKTMNEYTDSVDVIRKAAFEALGKIELKRKVRLVGVRVTNLKKA
jgi:DNA polymerase-4